MRSGDCAPGSLPRLRGRVGEGACSAAGANAVAVLASKSQARASALRRVTFFACPKKVTKERAILDTPPDASGRCAGIFRQAIHGLVEKRRASLRAALRAWC